jgi:hypothetical protein
LGGSEEGVSNFIVALEDVETDLFAGFEDCSSSCGSLLALLLQLLLICREDRAAVVRFLSCR